LTKSPLKFKPVVKDQLFYNRYEYCFSFGLAEANVLRELNHNLIDSKLDQRIEWRATARKRWQSSSNGYSWNVITDQIREDLHVICDIVINSSSDCKLVVSTHFGWIYTNDPKLIDQLKQYRCLTNKNYTRAVVNRPKNTVRLKKSLYQSRSYFINVKLTNQEKDNLKNFFANQKEHIRTSPSFNKWLNDNPYMRTQDYFFIDYTGEQWAVMLSLIRPGLIRRTLEIITK
jgi:hypothetical protein